MVLAITTAVLGVAASTALLLYGRQRERTHSALVKQMQAQKAARAAASELEESDKRLAAARRLIKILEGNEVLAKVKQGNGGRWRWWLTNLKGHYLAGSPPHGYDTAADARAAVQQLFPGRLGAKSVSTSYDKGVN